MPHIRLRKFKTCLYAYLGKLKLCSWLYIFYELKRKDKSKLFLSYIDRYSLSNKQVINVLRKETTTVFLANYFIIKNNASNLKVFHEW